MELEHQMELNELKAQIDERERAVENIEVEMQVRH